MLPEKSRVCVKVMVNGGEDCAAFWLFQGVFFVKTWLHCRLDDVTPHTHTHIYHHHHTVRVAKCTNVYVQISKWASWHKNTASAIWGGDHHMCKRSIRASWWQKNVTSASCSWWPDHRECMLCICASCCLETYHQQKLQRVKTILDTSRSRMQQPMEACTNLNQNMPLYYLHLVAAS